MPSATLTLDISYEDGRDVEKVVEALDRLVQTALSTKGVIDEVGPMSVGSLEILSADRMEGLLDELAAKEAPDDDAPYHCQNCFHKGPYSEFATDHLDPSVVCPKCGLSDTVFTDDNPDEK